MGAHPLFELSVDKEVRKAAGFRAVAAELSGEALAASYQRELESAPSRREAGKRYFVAHNARLASARRPGRDAEHLAIALLQWSRRTGEPLALPGDAGSLDPVHALVPLKSAAADPAQGAGDPNHGVGRVDLLALGPEGRLAVVQIKFLPPGATRGGTGDTPLRALLDALAKAAVVAANREAFAEEIAALGKPAAADGPPQVVLLGSPRYWELCRAREAQKGAAWIRELERLGREIEEVLGVGVHYLACRLEGDPGWSYPEGAPALDGPARLAPAWELGAGRVKPKPRPKPKVVAPADLPIEPDLTRPIRDYALTESYTSGDRITHPTLGLGVVQGAAGTGKISVLFGDRKSLLVHERPRSGAPPTPPSSG